VHISCNQKETKKTKLNMTIC